LARLVTGCDGRAVVVLERFHQGNAGSDDEDRCLWNIDLADDGQCPQTAIMALTNMINGAGWAERCGVTHGWPAVYYVT
jgi:hypothetical protein